MTETLTIAPATVPNDRVGTLPIRNRTSITIAVGTESGITTELASRGRTGAGVELETRRFITPDGGWSDWPPSMDPCDP